jgi:hippurate hydrolase
MLLGAARLLKERESCLSGRVRLMFQPAEELLQGAQDMLDHGLLDGGTPSAAFMLHVLTGLDLPAGTAIVSAPGVSAPSAATFEVRIQGKGCHGAMPHTGVDPITTAAHIVLALQQIGTRELSLTQSAALTIGMLQAGDTANVIPDRAVLRGSMRAFDADTHDFILNRIREISGQTAAVFRAAADTEVLSACPTLLNDAELSGKALSALQRLLTPQRALLSSSLAGSGSRFSGSEDFASVSHAVPSVMVALAAGQTNQGYVHPAHHPQTRFDESVLPTGAAIYAALAMAAMNGCK